jgi:hypothetical protein
MCHQLTNDLVLDTWVDMGKAYLCNMTLDIALRSRLDPESVIKTSAILNDVVFFDRGRDPKMIGMDFSVAEMVAGWCGGDEKEQRSLAHDRRFLEIFQSSEEILPAASRVSPLSEENRNLTNELGPKMIARASELGPSAFGGAPVGLMADPNGGVWNNIPTFVANDLLNFQRIKELEGDILGIFSPMHFLTQSDLTNSQLQQQGVSLKLSGTRSSKFPDFGLLSWPEIYELRLDPSLRSFRKKLKEMREIDKIHDFTDDNLSDLYFKDLEDTFRRRRPKPLKTFLRGVVGNGPIPIINPFGWLFAAADFKSDLKDFRDLNWINFISETKKLIDKKAE